MDQAALLSYAREAADFSTNHQLPALDFAINHYGQPDVAMFDFTCMYASENAAMVRQRHGHELLVALVGDSLLEVRWSEKRRLCFFCFFLKLSTVLTFFPLFSVLLIPVAIFGGLDVASAVSLSPSGPWAPASPAASWRP